MRGECSSSTNTRNQTMSDASLTAEQEQHLFEPYSHVRSEDTLAWIDFQCDGETMTVARALADGQVTIDWQTVDRMASSDDPSGRGIAAILLAAREAGRSA